MKPMKPVPSQAWPSHTKTSWPSTKPRTPRAELQPQSEPAGVHLVVLQWNDPIKWPDLSPNDGKQCGARGVASLCLEPR